MSMHASSQGRVPTGHEQKLPGPGQVCGAVHSESSQHVGVEMHKSPHTLRSENGHTQPISGSQVCGLTHVGPATHSPPLHTSRVQGSSSRSQGVSSSHPASLDASSPVSVVASSVASSLASSAVSASCPPSSPAVASSVASTPVSAVPVSSGGPSLELQATMNTRKAAKRMVHRSGSRRVKGR